MQGSLPQPNIHDRDPARGFSLRFWVMVCLTGVGAGLGGIALMELLYAVEHFTWSYHSGDFLTAVARVSSWHKVIALFSAGALAGVVRSLLKLETGGHGGELTESIWFRSGAVPAVRTLVRAVLSITIVAMGTALGREGALKQSGAVAASKLSEWSGLPPSQRRLLAACGAGAGIAAAYNIPFAGAMIALEVLLGSLALPLAIPALMASVIATAVSRLVLYSGPTYAVPAYGLAFSQIAWALVAGPILGLGAVLFVRVIGWADSVKPSGALAVLAPVVVLTALGAFSILYPEVLGNGKPLIQRLFVGEGALALLAVLLPLRLVATTSCLASGAPGGLLTPTMTYGALLGGCLGGIWDHILPGAAPGSYAVIGAACVYAASSQGPLSSVVLILELTHRADPLMIPLLVALVGAMLVTKAFGSQSVYTARVHGGIARAIAGEDARVVSAATRFNEIAARALSCPGSLLFPLTVADEQGRACGEVTRETLAEAKRLAVPLETATACDFMRPISRASKT